MVESSWTWSWASRSLREWFYCPNAEGSVIHSPVLRCNGRCRGQGEYSGVKSTLSSSTGSEPGAEPGTSGTSRDGADHSPDLSVPAPTIIRALPAPGILGFVFCCMSRVGCICPKRSCSRIHGMSWEPLFLEEVEMEINQGNSTPWKSWEKCLLQVKNSGGNLYCIENPVVSSWSHDLWRWVTGVWIRVGSKIKIPCE